MNELHTIFIINLLYAKFVMYKGHNLLQLACSQVKVEKYKT
jgi:hypothetical protein